MALTSGTPSGALLDSLLTSRFAAQCAGHRVTAAAELPVRLQHCVDGLPRACAWRAYRAAGRIFFAVARPAAGRQTQAGAALEAYFLDDDARAYSAAVWECDSKQGWWLDSVLPLSYDCEHGWWLPGLMAPVAARAASSASC
jgi:hypothetical protein